MNVSIDIKFIADIVIALTVIIGGIAGAYAFMLRHLNKYLDKKLAPLTKWTEKQQRDIEDAAERDAIMMDVQLASLEAIHEDRNNGNVTSAIDKLRQYMLKRSSKLSSYVKE